MTLFENISVNNVADQKKLVFYLNDQIGEQLFRSCLLANQQHGEHHEASSLLTNLNSLIYEKFPHSSKIVFNELLAKIPNLNIRNYEEFLKLASPGYQSKDLAKTDKAKKDLFKKIIQPIVGKNVGQLYKNEIEIRQLQPLNLKKSTASNSDNGEISSICALFDV